MHEIERERVGWQTDPDREDEASRHIKMKTKQARKGRREGKKERDHNAEKKKGQQSASCTN